MEFSSLYDAARKDLGTKWGVYDCSFVVNEQEIMEISFLTAWSPLSEGALVAFINHIEKMSPLKFEGCYGVEKGVGFEFFTENAVRGEEGKIVDIDYVFEDFTARYVEDSDDEFLPKYLDEGYAEADHESSARLSEDGSPLVQEGYLFLDSKVSKAFQKLAPYGFGG